MTRGLMPRVIFVLTLFIIIMCSIISMIFCSDSGWPVFHPIKNGLPEYHDREAALHHFVVCHVRGYEKERLTDIMFGTKDIYTLSESVGLTLTHYARKGTIDFFDKEYRFLKKKLMTDNMYIKWKTGDDANCNAVIDDLRIARALLEGYERFGNKEYFDTAGFIQDGIYSKQVIGGNLYEFYDWKSGRAKAVIPLCYIDLYTLDKLRVFNKSWLNIADRGLYIIKNGRMNNKCPFFYKYYDYKTGSYRPDEELEKEGGICITYTLYTAIHLSEINEDTQLFKDWLKNEMKEEKLYGWYNPETLKPSKDTESTAVYALAAIYSRLEGEEELYNKLINRMLDFMVTDEKSKYYGGFGNIETGEFYSFDNLTALWALGMANN